MSKSAWPSCETWWGHYTVNKHCPFSSIMHPATWQKLFRNGLRNMIEFKVLSQISIQSTHSEVFWSPCLDASELVWQHGGDLHNILYICKCIMFVYLGICTWMCFCMIMRLWWCINVNLLNLNFLHGLMNETFETLDEPVSIIIHCNSYTIAEIRIANVMHNYRCIIYFSHFPQSSFCSRFQDYYLPVISSNWIVIIASKCSKSNLTMWGE